jgi:hypothetical protein
MASRMVQNPSLPTTSAVLFTVIVVAAHVIDANDKTSGSKRRHNAGMFGTIMVLNPHVAGSLRINTRFGAETRHAGIC